MENEVLGVKLKTFNQIIDFLIFNELQSACALGKAAGLNENFTIPREIRVIKKPVILGEKGEETDEEMPDISIKNEKKKENGDDAWEPPVGWNNSQKNDEKENESTFNVRFF